MLTMTGWGADAEGEQSAGYRGSKVATPQVAVKAPPNVVQVIARYHFTTYLDMDGAVWTSGGNQQGERGIGNNNNVLTPTRVKLSRPATKIAAGGTHVLALLDDGTVASWGGDGYGQIGDGTIGEHIEGHGRQTPTLLHLKRKVIDIAAGGGSSMAIFDDGTVESWGENAHGQLGIGSHEKQLLPVPVVLPTAAQKIAMGGVGSHGAVTLALCEDALYGWGRGTEGQLGEPRENVLHPRKMSDKDVRAIDAALSHTLVLNSEGEVTARGATDANELGRPDSGVVPLAGVTAISAGMRNSLFIANGLPYSAGETNGRESDYPLGLIEGVGNASIVAAGDFHCMALVATAPAIEEVVPTPTLGGTALRWKAPPTTERWAMAWRAVTHPKGKWSKRTFVAADERKGVLTGMPPVACEVQLTNKAFGIRIVEVRPL